MSELHDKSMTIYEALQAIREDRFVMPAFQRQFVWSMAQIEKLWDSILLDYPISTFLFWHVDDSNISWDTYCCAFRQKVVFDSRKQPDDANYELTNINTKITNTAVLDGQQRLTALLLSLYGEVVIRPSYAKKKTGPVTLTKLLIELNQHKIDVDEEEYNSKKYDIRFSDKVSSKGPTQFEVRSILGSKFQNEDTRAQAIEDAISNVPADSKEYARGILEKLYQKVFVEKLIRYTEILDMKQDDALEMFVRFNSGGKALKKSEITMSILEAYWPSAKTEFGKILVGSYEHFDTDFIIRTALMLYGDVLKSNISKKVVDELKDNWSEFKVALNNLEDLLNGLKIDINRFSGSWNVLLPIIYYIYWNKDYAQNTAAVQAYLIRAVFFTYFQSGTTGKLNQMRNYINNNEYEITIDMLDQIADLRVTEGKIEDILNAEKGNRVTGEVLYYLGLDWIKPKLSYHQDHLHPDARFSEGKPITITTDDWRRWRTLRGRLPNLQLYEGHSNESKGDTPLQTYIDEMNEAQKAEFLSRAMIPEGAPLEFQYFEDFYNKRKAHLAQRIKELLGYEE